MTTDMGVGASITVELSVRLDEIDYLGIVHASNYLKYLEHVRVKLLEQQKVDLLSLVNKGVRAVVVNDTINYGLPAKYNDLLSISCWIEKFGNSSATLGYTITDKNTGIKVLDANTTMVCIDNDGKPTPIPAEVKEALSN
jgi:acyl-CoA thioester hydrolase